MPRSRRFICGLLAAVSVTLSVQAADGPPAGGIAVEQLPPITIDAIGVPSAAGLTFEDDLWRGASFDSVLDRLSRLPVEATSPTLHALQRGVLAAPGEPPRAASGGPAGAFLTARLSALLRSGGWETVTDLADRVPTARRTPDIARIDAEARLLSGTREGACRVVRSTVESADPSETFWLRAMALCQMASGDPAKAGLSLDLLHETGQGDARFSALVRAQTDDTGREPMRLDGPAQPDPLLAAAALAAAARPPLAWSEAGEPWLTRAIAETPTLPIAMRVVAAERAHAAGAIPADAVRALYTEAEGAKPDGSTAQEAALTRAEAFRTTAVMTSDRDRADAVLQALDAARAAGRFVPTAAIYAPLVETITPSLDLVGRAGALVPVLLLVGAAESASEWLVLADAESEANSAALAALVATAPFVALMDPRAEDDARFERWAARDAAARPDQAALLAAAIRGLGGRVPQALASAAAPAEVTAAESVLPADRSVGPSGSTGEMVLGVLESFAGRSPESWEPAALERALQALRQGGIDRQARHLALEAAAAHGL